jgi:hypothetical protein
MSLWWPFKRNRLEPLKTETRRNDHEIIALDRAVAEEQEAAHGAHLRLHRAVIHAGRTLSTVGSEFVSSVRDMSRDLNGGT